MRRASTLGLLVLLAASVSMLALGQTQNGCRCDSDCGFEIVGEHTTTVGISMPTIVIAGIPLTGSVGLAVHLDRTVKLIQRCTCWDYCCPDEGRIHPVGYATVTTREFVSDQIIPGRSRCVYHKGFIVLANGKSSWHWIAGPDESGNPPQTCAGEKSFFYTVATGGLSFDYSVGVGGVSYTRSISLVSHSATFYCKASGCKQKKNLPPWFIDSPSGPICLTRGGSNEFTVLAYDPNGVEDIAKIAINRPLPPGLSAEVTGIKTVEHGGVLAKLATVTVHWNSGNGAKQIEVYVEDRAGECRLVPVPLELITPPQITVEDGPLYDPGIHAYTMRLRVTNPNSEQLDIGLVAELSDSEAGSLRFGLGQGTKFVVVSPGPGDSEEIGLVFYPNPDRHCHITIKIKSSIITKCGVVTEQSWPFAANNQPRIDSIQPVTASAGRVVRVRVPATDEDKDTVTLEQISGPGDLDISQSKPGSVIGIYTWATTKHDPWYLVALRLGLKIV